MAETRSGNRQEIVGKLTANGLKLSKKMALNGHEMVKNCRKVARKWYKEGLRRPGNSQISMNKMVRKWYEIKMEMTERCTKNLKVV